MDKGPDASEDPTRDRTQPIRGIDPSDAPRIFALLYTRLACLTLIDSTPLAAQEVTKETVPGIVNLARAETTVACSGAIKVEAVPEIKKMGFVSIKPISTGISLLICLEHQEIGCLLI